MSEDYPVFIDCEASSLSTDSYPIEIAWNFPTGEIESHMINPYLYPRSYNDWAPDAQAVHGLSREYLMKEGKDPKLVISRMESKLKYYTLLTDAPDWDSFWVERLYAAVGEKCNLKFGNALELFSNLESCHFMYEGQARQLSGKGIVNK